MAGLVVGSIVLIPFPFSDLGQTKLRPAVCLADVGYGDWVLSQITSNPYGDHLAIECNNSDFKTGGLKMTSYIRPGKLFTANQKMIVNVVGELNQTYIIKVLNCVIALFQPPTP